MEPVFLIVAFIAIIYLFITRGQAGNGKAEVNKYETVTTSGELRERTVDDVNAEAQAIFEAHAPDPMMQAYSSMDSFIDKHIDTLWAKKRQLTYIDDYGIENSERFEVELNYFVANVLPTQLIEDYMSTIPSFYESSADCANRIIRQKLKWHNRTMNRLKDEAIDKGEVLGGGPEYRADLSGVEFEKLVQINYEMKGYSVKGTPITGDQGVDLLLKKDGRTIAVQCKRSGSAVGNKAIQEVATGKIHYGADEAWVVSDAEFTAGARSLASTNGVLLINYFSL